MPPSSIINGDNDNDVEGGYSYNHHDDGTDDSSPTTRMSYKSAGGGGFTKKQVAAVAEEEEKKEDEPADESSSSPTAVTTTRIAKSRYLRAVHYANVHNARYSSSASGGTAANRLPTTSNTSNTSNDSNGVSGDRRPVNATTTPTPAFLNKPSASTTGGGGGPTPVSGMRGHVPVTRPLKPPSYADSRVTPVPRKYMRPNLSRVSSPVPVPAPVPVTPSPTQKRYSNSNSNSRINNQSTSNNQGTGNNHNIYSGSSMARPSRPAPVPAPAPAPAPAPQQASPSPLPLPPVNHHHAAPVPSSSASLGSASENATAASNSTAPTSNVVPTSSSSSSSLLRSDGRNESNNGQSLSQSHPLAQSSADAIGWRKHGKLFRARLVLEDEDKGGNAFTLSNDCSIERYYKVAERVLEQFLSTSIRRNASDEELSESYLVGNRLVKFLSMGLPTHHQYFSNTDPKLLALRKRSQGQLVELLQYLEEIALVIDEIQYNKYLVRDLSPEEEDLVRELTGGKGMMMGNKAAPNTAPIISATQHPNSKTTTIVSSSSTTTNGDADNSTISSSTRMAGPKAPPSLLPHQHQPKAQNTNAPSCPVVDITDGSHTEAFSNISGPNPSTLTDGSHLSINTESFSVTDDLHERVAQVVRVTEAFSDTYEQTSSEGRDGSSFQPNLYLKQTLLAAAASAQLMRATSPASNWSNNSNNIHNDQEQQYPDPALFPPKVNRTNRTTAASKESTSRNKLGQTSVDLSDSFWDSDSFGDDDEWDFHDDQNSTTVGGPQNISTVAALHSHIDLLEEGSDLKPPRQQQQQRNTRNTKTTSKSSVPKLKRPPSRPTRAEMARAAAALQFDEMYMQSQIGGDRLQQQQQSPMLPQPPMGEEDILLEREATRSDADVANTGAATTAEPVEVIKTKIEQRWERAAEVQRELKVLDQRQEKKYARPRPEVVNPNNPFNDDFDEDGDENSIEDAGEEASSRQLTSNRNILRHFKGCVKCLLD